MYISLRGLSTSSSTSRNRNINTPNLSKTPQSSAVGNSWMSTNRRVDKSPMAHPYNGILHRNEKEQTARTCNMNESHKHNADCKKPNNKESITYDSIFIKFLKMQNWSMMLRIRRAVPHGIGLRLQGDPWGFLGFW